MSANTSSLEDNESRLTKAQLDRIQKNKQRALNLKHSRLVTHPYSKTDVISIDKSTIKIGTTKYKDTGGGFLLEEQTRKEPEELPEPVQKEPPIFEPDRPTCENCEKVFASSWLFDTFSCKVCDECKDPEVHKLVTKTEAQNEYLLKDCDLDKRDPPLKFIRRKNPHNVHWGEMKLYLQIQVEKRALEVWGSEENLQKQIERREEMRIVAKSRKYNKEMRALRMNMRSSLFDRTSAASHTHAFGPETYNEEDDIYTHSCLTCQYEENFEKM